MCSFGKHDGALSEGLYYENQKDSTLPPQCMTFQQVSCRLELLAVSVKWNPTADLMGGKWCNT